MPKRAAKDWLSLDEGEEVILRGEARRETALRIAVYTTLGTTAVYGVLGSFVGLFSWSLVPVFALIFYLAFAAFMLGLRHQGDWALTDRALHLRKGMRFGRDSVAAVKPMPHAVVVTIRRGNAIATQRLDTDAPSDLTEELKKTLESEGAEHG
ncbi:hypothetical protein O2N63_00335 [Aliiroseovarius sp. KMU-50]|uniref:DUF2244 domain-containing protein n=1 Tax=Aliiroseovarius salicola TaxID=3009082 RepID=A0ABT4VWA8_9RHOB|nr:hypothetical protein [Aliiroseovarius sp. KMU-50]MDA5092536.1 hypothetical protein [Aliiroseovarius sp. KMU-50]